MSLHVSLWHRPYNGGWVWFSRLNLKRFAGGWIAKDHKLWWAILGFSGTFTIQSWPWSRYPGCTCHPDDAPPFPCARKYALSECRGVQTGRQSDAD